MYQHIQLRRLSSLCPNATSQKVDGLDALKQKEASDIYAEDDVLVLKELSNKMDELEEVILVEDEPALRLPQLSNESWSNFVEELSKKYECDEHLTTSVPRSSNAKRKFQIADYTQSSVNRVNAATNDSGVVSISSDEDEQSSTVIPAEQMLSSSKDFPLTIEVFRDNNSCTSSAHVESNEDIVSFEERNTLDSGQLNENCTTAVTERVNNEATQHSTEPISNVKSGVADGQHQIRHNAITASKNSTPCADNIALLERSKASNLSKHKGLIGINKKYQDIKRRTYKLTFHQIFQIFDIEKSAPSIIGAIPGQPIELDFPDHDMKEFVKIVKSYQATESTEEVRHLWTQIKSWLSAMKPAYGTPTNYTKYHKKLNWYITELMAQYIKFEIENSIQNENYYKLKMEALMNTVSSLLNDDVNLKILTLLRTDFPDKPSNFLDDLFKKYLTHPKVRLENNNYGIYRLKVLAFQKWMHYTNRKRLDIVELAIKEGSAYLPRMVPKNTEDPYCRIDQYVHLIDDYDKQGTRKLLEENVNIEVLKATINQYLQVYESQLYDDFGYRLLRRQGLEHSQTRAPRDDDMQKHRHSPKAITVRSDARHCNRRRTHQTHTHLNSSSSSSSRATHLPAGCDIQRNRLSSSPFRTNKCSCKSLIAKHQSDTSLSCKTPSGNDIISLDSTDDEDDKQTSEKLSIEKSSMNTEKRNQSTQPRLVKRIRHALQPQIVENRQTNTTTQRTRPCQAHAPRHRKLPPKKVDTIVLDSSSSEDEDTNAVLVDVCDEVNKHKIDKLDDIQTEEPTTPSVQPQQTPQQQQAPRARLQSVSMPLRCALIGSVAIKPIRKEKHCIPGEVSSTTSHDIIETASLNAAPAGSCSANSVANNASAYENAREVGTVEILERRELHQPVVMAERCFQPGKLLLGIDYSDDENDDEVAERSREHIAAGSETEDDDDGISNGCFISMVGGYSKVVEEATSSTEVFQRIQSLENVAAAKVLSIVEPAPVVLARLAERAPNVVAVRSEDTPTCSKYANSNATNASESKGADAQKEASRAAAQVAEYKSGKNIKITVKELSSANIIGRGKDTPEGRLEEDVESVAFGLLAGLINIDEQRQASDKNVDESSIKTVPISTEELRAVNKETQDIHSDSVVSRDSVVKNNATHLPTEDDETAAIDQMLADIDENLRESHEFNEKYLKSKNAANIRNLNVHDKLTVVCENVQNDADLTNNAIASNSNVIEGAAPAKSALTHTNDDNLLLHGCESVSELAKSSDVDSEVEARVTAMETKSTELAKDTSSNDELLSEKPLKRLTLVEEQTLQTATDIHSEASEVVKGNKDSVKHNDDFEPAQESDLLHDICSRAVKTSVSSHLTKTQTNSNDQSSKPKECQQQNEDTETVGLEKYTLAIEDTPEKCIETDSGDEFLDADLNKSGLDEMNAEDKVEETDISPELMAEEHIKDMEVLEKPVEAVDNGIDISSQIDVDMNTELEDASERADNFGNELNNVMTDIAKDENKKSEVGKCDLDTEMMLESQTVVDYTEDVEKDDSDKTSEKSEVDNIERNITSADAVQCIESETIDNNAMSAKAISEDSDKSNELEFVEDIENRRKDVKELDNEPCTTIIESPEVSELAATNIGEVTDITVATVCIETENETTPIAEEFSNVANEVKERETIDDADATVNEKTNLDLLVKDSEHHDSVSRNSEKVFENKEKFTKQNRELIEKSNSTIEEAAENEIIPLISKDNGSTAHEKVLTLSSSIEDVKVGSAETVNDTKQSDKTEETSLLESSTKIQVNESVADELANADIKIKLKPKGIECHEISDFVTSNAEESGDKMELASEYLDSTSEEKIETTDAEPLATANNINNSHKTEEEVTKNATEQTTLLESATKSAINESEARGSEDIEYKNLPEDARMTIEDGFETADVGTLPISHKIIVSASNEIEKEVEDEVIEGVTQTEDENKRTCAVDEWLMTESDFVTEETHEMTDIELTLETTADTSAATDDSIEELDNSNHDDLEENKQLIETSDSQTDAVTTYEDSNEHNANISTEINEMSSHGKTISETPSEVQAKSATNDETNEPSAIVTKAIESLLDEKIGKSDAVDVVEEEEDYTQEMAKKECHQPIESQTEVVRDVENTKVQKVTDSTIEPQERETLDEIHTNETSADSAKEYEAKSEMVALSNSITDATSDQCALGNVLPTQSFDEDSDQNANSSEEKMKESLEVKEIAEEQPNVELTDRCEISTEVENVQKNNVESTVITEAVEETASTQVEMDEFVPECEREIADTNTVNNNNQCSLEKDTLLEGAIAWRSESETVKTSSRQKLKVKSKPHKLIKTGTIEKNTTNCSRKVAKLKAGRNLKKILLTEDASGKIRIKRRLSPSNDHKKDLGNVDVLQTAEELADNIAKLVIKENLEVAEDTAAHENELKAATSQDDSIKQGIDSGSLEDNTEIIENQTSDDINDETEQKMLSADAELSEDCTTFQCLPSEYNSEEILAVATLINMRNKYASSTYIDEDNVVIEMPPEINRDEEAENVESAVAPDLKKTSKKEAIVKKKVRFDEDNLLELMNEKFKALKKVKKSGKKIEKSRKAEGAVLSGAGGGKKYVKRRLLELTTNSSTNEVDYVDYVSDEAEQTLDLKKRCGRKCSTTAKDELLLSNKMDELLDELKSDSAGNNNPIYPVRLTSRRKSETTADAKLSKSIKNSVQDMKYEASTTSDVEDTETDFIVPDDEVAPLCTETYEKSSPTKETILKVSRVCVDGTKIKFKITPKKAMDKETPAKSEKLQVSETLVEKEENRAVEEKICAKNALMKTRKVTVKLKRMKMPLYATAITKGSIFSSVVQSATLTDSEDLILPESPTKFKELEELDIVLPESTTKSKKRDESNLIVSVLSTKSKKREDVDPIVSESLTKSKKQEDVDLTLPVTPTKSKEREELDPIVKESSTKYKKLKLESYFGSHESKTSVLDSPKSKNNDKLFIAKDDVSSQSLGKTSHRKHRAKSPNINKKSVKRDIFSALSELPTVQGTDIVDTQTNTDQTNVKNVSIQELSPNKQLPLESAPLGNVGVVENIDPMENIDSNSKITVKPVHKKRLAKTSSSELSPTPFENTVVLANVDHTKNQDLSANIIEKSVNKKQHASPINEVSLESTSFVNAEVVENVDPAKNQDSSVKRTFKTAHKKRHPKSSSKIKFPDLSTTCKNAATSIKQELNKEPPTLRDAAIEKTACNNEISVIKDVDNVSTRPYQELSPRKNVPLAETSFDMVPIVPSEQLENMDVGRTKNSSANITLKTARKKRAAKSTFKIKLPISSSTTKNVSSIESTLNMQPSMIKDSAISETSPSIVKVTSKTEESTETDAYSEKMSVMKDSTNKKDFALKKISPKKKLATVLQKLPLEKVEIAAYRNYEKNKVLNLSAEVVPITPEKAISFREHVLSDAEIKIEPLEDIQIKEEEDSCEDPIDFAQSYLNIERRHAKEFVLKPCDVILTEAKINEQAEAHRGLRKQRNRKLALAVENSLPKSLNGNIYKARRNKASTTDISKSAENIIENLIPTRKESTQIEVSVEVSKEQEKPKVQKELQAETTREDRRDGKELPTKTTKDDKVENKAAKNVETTVTVEKEIQQDATLSTADVESEAHASSITDTVIAELKLLSPESLQSTEDDKEQLNLITCSENVAIRTVDEIEKEQEAQPTPPPTDIESTCKVENSDEEQKTAQQLDSSIDIVFGNATFTKKPLTPKKDDASLKTETVVNNLSQKMIDLAAEAQKPDGICETTPTKNRLDILTAEKINSVLENVTEEKNNLLKECQNQAITTANVRPTIRRQTNTEEEGMRKSSNRSSLNSVKQISAKVPDALFADDESESSNADDSTSDEQFFAPILSLDDLLSKKDEPTANITHTYTPQQEQAVQETDAGHSHDGLGTPNFTVELEVETTQASDENSQSVDSNRKVESQSDDTDKCAASEELNTNLEETDANFLLSAIADISTIDILNINNEYPDLLDNMLFEQKVRQSNDCMISGTNSAKKWSQDSFATTKAQVNFNKTETAVRTDVAPSVPITQENDVIATIDKTVATNAEDAIGIGQETFLGTISSLDEVEVPTTGFDLVDSFTIADFLSDAGSDFFAFPELDKTQSRSNSFSAESNLCETPPPPAIDTADEETSNDKKDENSIQSLTNHNTNSVACDHSYNKDINEVEKQRTKVRKKSTSSNPFTPTALQSSTKSAASSPSNNSDMLQVFSRAKCLPKPFWKVKKTEEIKTSTPKKEEPTSNTQNTQLQTPTATMTRAITFSPITVKNTEEKQTVFSMPALELVIEQTALQEEITATPSNNAKPKVISTTESESLTNLNENIEKAVEDVTQASKFATETGKADVLEEVAPNSLDRETRLPKCTSTPIELTEVITIPPPLIVQPIIRIQSQTNRLERIDPSSSTSQQAFPFITPENQPTLIDAPNASQIEVNHICRPERDSTPTLDEPTKDEYEFSTPTDSLTVEELTHPAKARQSPTQLDEPTAKRICVENVNKTITTNDIFDMLKSEEKLQKENCQKTDTTSAKIIVSKSKQTDNELMEIKVTDETKLHTNTEATVNSLSTNLNLKSSKVENISSRPYIQSAQIEEEKEASESSTSKQQTDTKSADISSTKQNNEKLSHSQEPILISKETLIALKKREHASKKMSIMTITEHMEHLQPLSPESTPEKCYKKFADNIYPAEKEKTSPAGRIEENKEEKSATETIKDVRSQPNQSNDCQPTRSKPVQSKNTQSITMLTTKLDPNQSNVMPPTLSTEEHSSSARTSILQSKKQKGSNASPALSNVSPCVKSLTNVYSNKTHENTKTSKQTGIMEKEGVCNTPPIKSNINMKIRDLPITEVLNKSEIKSRVSPCQAAAISPRTRVTAKPTLAVAPTLLPQNTNRYHPYQETQTPTNTLNTHKSKVTPQRQSRDSLSATAENVSNKKKETPKSVDKTTPQRSASTVTTLPPLMQSRPTPSHLSSFGTPPTIIDLASIKLTAEEEADIARKLAAYRTTLPRAETYGAHKANQRLVEQQEKKLRLEYAERASRRKAQQMRDTQRLKRKSQNDSYEAHYKKFAMHSAKSDIPNSSSSSSSSRSSSSVSVAAGHHQSRTKQYPQHPRPHHEYVNKFGEIEKLVEKEKVTKDTEIKRSVPLTASTAWEPKMPTGDELIELLSKTKKS